ncbi:MAG: polyphenol oxidase family protein [Thermoleophilia bacterium]
MTADDQRASQPPGAALLRHDAGGPVWFEARGDGWRAAFSTRLGGVSPAPFDSLNLSFSTDDDPGNVWRNRLDFAAAAGAEAGDLVVPGQVHGTTIVEVGSGERGRGARGRTDVVAAADGLITAAAGVPLLVSFADCVPVMLVAGSPARVLALVHAGWRGMLAGIVAEAARAVGTRGAARAAVIGPSIGPCCFAVSPDVGEHFEAAFPGTWREGRVDLWEAARRQLAEGGFAPADIVSSGLCTCHDRQFFSHRREHGLTGRQAAIAWITGGV